MLYDMSCDALCFHNEWPVGTNPSCGPIYQQGRLERKAERHNLADVGSLWCLGNEKD